MNWIGWEGWNVLWFTVLMILPISIMMVRRDTVRKCWISERIGIEIGNFWNNCLVLVQQTIMVQMRIMGKMGDIVTGGGVYCQKYGVG